MRHVSAGHRGVASVLITAICLVGLPVFGGHSSANISGTILRTEDGAPIAGATVKVARHADAKIFESARTGVRGNYMLSDLPAGTYDLAVQTEDGMYLVGAPLALEPGERRSLSLSVRPHGGKGQTADEPEPTPPNPPPPEPTPNPPTPAPEPGTPAPTPTEPPPAENPPPVKKKGFFRTPWGGAVIVAGTAIIVGAIANSSDNDKPANASPR